MGTFHAEIILETLAQDFRQAFRSLRRSPGFTLVAIVTIALTIGVNTAILSFADVILFRPLPYREADRIFTLSMRDPKTGKSFGMVAPWYVRAMNMAHKGFSKAGIAEAGSIFMVEAGHVVEVGSVNVTANYFELLGVKAFRGRLFEASDESVGNRAIVLSYPMWKSRFGGDERIVGKAIRLNDTRRGETTFDVIGVLPPDFVFPSPFGMRTQFAQTVWQPGIITVEPPGGLFNAPPPAGTLDIRGHDPFVRLAPGVTQAQAQAEIDSIAQAVNPDRPSTPTLTSARVALYGDRTAVVGLLLAAALFVLLIGCANLSNMLLVRGHSFERETGVRTALGASRGRLVRPLIVEGVVVSACGGILAIGLASIGFSTLLSRVPLSLYGSVPVGIDLRVIFLSMALSLSASLIFSILPAWRLYRFDALALIQGRRKLERGRSIGGPMLAVQIALAIVLVAGAVMTARSLNAILQVPLGFKPEGVLSLNIYPGPNVDARKREAIYAQAIQTVAARGDVLGVGAVGSLPVDDIHRQETAIYLANRGEASIEVVDAFPGYLEAAGTSVIRGRTIGENDFHDRTSVAVISKSAALMLFDNTDPIGQSFLDPRVGNFTIIGVAEDIRRNPERAPNPVIYTTPRSLSSNSLYLVVHLRERRERSVLEIRQAIAASLPAGTAINAAWWTDLMDGWSSYSAPRFQTLIFSTLAFLALGLVALGVFSVVAFLVNRKSQEIGIRLALGATRASIKRLMVAQVAIPVATGAFAGYVISLAVGRIAEAYLFHVQANSVSTMVAAVFAVIGVGIGASYFPARQASRLDPMRTLRQD